VLHWDFGDGTTGFPGEFALTFAGVLLFAEVEQVKPEIIAELAVRLKVSSEDTVLSGTANRGAMDETIIVI
jgi:hypothetical protein